MRAFRTALPGAEVVWEPQINQGLVRFTRNNDTPERDDAYTDEVIQRINATGEAFFSGTTWRGRRAMRVSATSSDSRWSLLHRSSLPSSPRRSGRARCRDGAAAWASGSIS